ncbi:UbiD family decarboxylase [Thermoplasmatales archaeon AK]|nr:UbiD family decarboxylase [Thermoplasmatales archaeon AK]
MANYYRNLQEYLSALEKSGKLVRVKREIKKETELTPLARLQYRGLPESDRKGFLFENVTDVKGRKYDIKVATGVYASSLQIYAMGLNCEPSREAIAAKWEQAQLHPVKTEEVDKAPSQDIVIKGDDLLKPGSGIEALPVPVELPGFSGQIRTTTQFITVDPKTGIQNVGNYSTHVFGQKKLLWEINRGNHGIIHWRAWKELKKPMPAAVIIGGPPSFFYVAAAKLPYGVDELTVAGGFAGEPVKTVKGKTVDLQVPAEADIIIEGYVSTDYMEPGNAFGEYTGYMATDVWLRPVFEVTAVTMRKDPVFVHIMSQFPPSESSMVRRVSSENVYLKFLKYDAKVPGIIDVVWHEMSQAQWCVIKIKKMNKAHPWQVLNLAAAYDSRWGKFFIVVDDDIDARSLDSVIWAMSWRVQPARDMRIINGRIPGLDPSAYSPGASHEEKEFPGGVGSSAVLIDATTKFPYPPTSLPRREYMENALKIWKELKLPELNLVEPWYGYELGYWPEEFRKDAEDIVKGEHYKIGERLAKKGEKV